MRYAVRTDDAWTELPVGVDVATREEIKSDEGVETIDCVTAYESVRLWPEEYREDRGIFEIAVDSVPEGKIATGYAIVDRDGRPYQSWTLEDAPPPPVPQVISDRQFAYALAIKGRLTFDEAEEWSAVGALPQIVLDALEHVPEENHQRVIVRGKLRAAKEYHRNDPATVLMAELMGETPEFMDEVWRIGADL